MALFGTYALLRTMQDPRQLAKSMLGAGLIPHRIASERTFPIPSTAFSAFPFAASAPMQTKAFRR